MRSVIQTLTFQATVQQAVVVGIAHAERGQDVAAAVVPAAGVDLDSERVMNHLRQLLSSYKLPRHVSFFDRGDLPTLGDGKVDRRSLAELLTARH